MSVTEILTELPKLSAAELQTIRDRILELEESQEVQETTATIPADALARLHRGYHLRDQPLIRDQAHTR